MSQPSKVRIQATDIRLIEYPVEFHGIKHVLNLIATCYGDFLVQSIHGTKVLIDTEDISVASNHFSAVSKRCTSLQHANKKLEEHIQVIKVVILAWLRYLDAYGGVWGLSFGCFLDSYCQCA
jgi:hypothetical protein